MLARVRERIEDEVPIKKPLAGFCKIDELGEMRLLLGLGEEETHNSQIIYKCDCGGLKSKCHDLPIIVNYCNLFLAISYINNRMASARPQVSLTLSYFCSPRKPRLETASRLLSCPQAARMSSPPE